MNICLFSQDEISQPLPLRDERAQHILKVLHKDVGDTFTAGIIGGQSGVAKITGRGEEGISFEFAAGGDGKPLTNLEMIIGFPRPIQLKRLLRDIAALGVCRVHLTGTDLGEKSYMQSNLVEHGAAYKMLLLAKNPICSQIWLNMARPIKCFSMELFRLVLPIFRSFVFIKLSMNVFQLFVLEAAGSCLLLIM